MENQDQVKNLTLEYLNELEASMEVVHDVVINNISIKIRKFFKKTEVSKLIKEAIKQISENKVKQSQIEDFIFPYLNMLMIKYFTSLEMPDDMNEQLRIMEVLMNKDLLVPIINQFPEEEVLKVYDEFGRVLMEIHEVTDKVDGNIDNLTLENKEEILSILGRK